MALLAKFTLWANPGTVAWSGVGASDNKVRGGGSIKDEILVHDARGGDGRIFASNVVRDQQTSTWDVTIQSATSVAAAVAMVDFPAPGAVVTIAGFSDSTFDGSWNYVGGAEIVPGQSDADPVVIRNITIRRVSTDGSTVAAQTVVS